MPKYVMFLLCVVTIYLFHWYMQFRVNHGEFLDSSKIPEVVWFIVVFQTAVHGVLLQYVKRLFVMLLSNISNGCSWCPIAVFQTAVHGVLLQYFKRLFMVSYFIISNIPQQYFKRLFVVLHSSISNGCSWCYIAVFQMAVRGVT